MNSNFEPIEITQKDIEKTFEYLNNYEIRMKKCHCGRRYIIGNYSDIECDECFFGRWPEKERKEFFENVLKNILE